MNGTAVAHEPGSVYIVLASNQFYLLCYTMTIQYVIALAASVDLNITLFLNDVKIFDSRVEAPMPQGGLRLFDSGIVAFQKITMSKSLNLLHVRVPLPTKSIINILPVLLLFEEQKTSLTILTIQ